jgi:D-serine deaminase-like pyridoxal phosphate-dependent protein
MRKKCAAQAGSFNPRIVVAFGLCSVGVLLAMLSFAGTPSSVGLANQQPAPEATIPLLTPTPTPTPGPAQNDWSIVSSPNATASPDSELLGVTCASASDCWAVGYYKTASVYQTLIERWDGTSWAIVSSPNASTTQTNFLAGVTCVSASNCWAVGYYITGTAEQTLIEHWDGASWAIVTSPNTSATQRNFLQGVTCVSASECWAVGYYAGGTIFQTLIERWDGTSWAIVSSPNASTTQSNYLFGVTCVSASECWAIGDYVGSAAFQTLIERWDGTSWAIVSSPNTSTLQNNLLSGVTCVSASECWAVGYFADGNTGINQPLIEQWNGTLWAIVISLPTNTSQSNYLNGVTCVSASECWAVGSYNGGGGAWQTLIERWDGTSWAIVTSPNTDATQNDFLQAVTCVSASDCWAVGFYTNSIGQPQTLTEHYGLPFVQLSAAASRKSHGSAGTFDVELPLTGSPGIECRSGGANGDYTMIFTFANPLTSVGGASVTSGTGSVSGGNIDSNDAHNYIVNLTGVTNAQTITVNLNNVTDSAGDFSSAVSASMGVLLGDVNGNKVVSNTDVASVKTQVAAPVTASNFRNDVTANGVISNTDVSTTKAQVGTTLP